MNIQLKEVKDFSLLIEWREEVIRNVFGLSDAENFSFLKSANLEYYMKHINDGSHVAIMAYIDSEPVGCGGVCFYEELPSPDNPSGRCAYIMNVYVRKQFRQNGIASEIVSELIKISHKRKAGKIYLESTTGARKLYRHLGFGDMKDMMALRLSDNS